MTSKREIISSRRRRLVRAIFRLVVATVLFVVVAFPPRSKLDLQLLGWVRARSVPAAHSEAIHYSNANLQCYSTDGVLCLSPTSSIPRVLLRTNKTWNSNNINEKDTWRRRNAFHVLIFADDATAEQLVATHFSGRVARAFFTLPLAVQRADFIRYLLLAEFGGVYADLDTKALVNIDHWTHGLRAAQSGVSLIVGVEDFAVINGYDQLTQWTVAAAPRHPFLIYFVDKLTENILTSPPHVLESVDAVTGLTGPAYWSKIFWEWMQQRYPYYNLQEVMGLERARKVVGGILILGQVYWRWPGIYVQHFGAGEMVGGWKKSAKPATNVMNSSILFFSSPPLSPPSASFSSDNSVSSSLPRSPPSPVKDDTVSSASTEGLDANTGEGIESNLFGVPPRFIDTTSPAIKKRKPLLWHTPQTHEPEHPESLHESWKIQNPSFLTLNFPGQDVERFIAGSFTHRVWKAFMKLTGHDRVVLGRLLMLYHFGGFTALSLGGIANTVPIKDWDGILGNTKIQLVMSASRSSGDGDLSNSGSGSSTSGMYIFPAVIGATPKHPFLRDVILKMTQIVLEKHKRLVWSERFVSEFNLEANEYLRRLGMREEIVKEAGTSIVGGLF
ncbi:UNVERIFIED_CONTAM: membrane-bound alpha-1,6- mannosyltransferase Initiation-specific [Siphonaria sp. JEL0065]|nr:membrane-bound alpha-1,6- mannosyltransferase Initiation-specific [Siphonaria sp. JEL0065]